VANEQQVQPRTDAEREHALVQRQLRRQMSVRTKPRRKFRFQFVLAALLAGAAVAIYASEALGWWTYIGCAGCVLMSACVLIA
jgi:hypothetical protein